MISINYIMDLIDWNNSEDNQAKGIELAQEVKCISIFLQPVEKYYNKNVWDNCAKILSERSDQELSTYLIPLMKWLQDMNWPGAFCILDRLQKYEKDLLFEFALDTCIKYAKALEDDVWENNLQYAYSGIPQIQRQ